MFKISNLIKGLGIYKISIVLLFIVGIFLRALFLSYGRPLWNDEAALALNIINKWNYFMPLDYSQAAPQLFMYLSKIFYLILPAKTFALRIVPFVSSLLSLLVFYKLVVKVLDKKVSQAGALAVFALCYPLCRYAQEFKQYSSDVLCFLLILLSYFYLEKISEKGIWSKALYGIACSLLVWLSFSSFFALFTLLILVLIYKRGLLKSLLLPVLITGVNCLAVILVNLHLNANAVLHSYWASSFINKGFLHFLYLNISNTKYIFNIGLPFFFVLLSLVLMFIKQYRSDKTYLIVIPLLLTLMLSYLQVYPYSTRIILFLIPIFILLCFKLVDFIKFKVVGFLFALLVFFPVCIESAHNIVFRGYDEENILTPLQIISKEAKPDDVVYISDGNSILYEYYKSQVALKNPVIIENTRYNDENEYIANLENLEKGKTYYWVFAHHPKKFERLRTVYLWAKEKPDFRIYSDKKGNALIRFTTF